jgi:hypothetical protein
MGGLNYASSYREIRRRSSWKVVRDIMLFALYRFYKYRGLIEPALVRPRVHFTYMHHVFRDEEKEFVALLECLSHIQKELIVWSEEILIKHM